MCWPSRFGVQQRLYCCRCCPFLILSTLSVCVFRRRVLVRKSAQPTRWSNEDTNTCVREYCWVRTQKSLHRRPTTTGKFQSTCVNTHVQTLRVRTSFTMLKNKTIIYWGLIFFAARQHNSKRKWTWKNFLRKGLRQESFEIGLGD